MKAKRPRFWLVVGKWGVMGRIQGLTEYHKLHTPMLGRGPVSIVPNIAPKK